MSRPVFAVRVAKRPASAKGVWGHARPWTFLIITCKILHSEYVLNVWDVQILCQKVYFFCFKDWKMLIKGKYLNNFVLFWIFICGLYFHCGNLRCLFMKLSVPLTNLPSRSSFPNFLHQSQDISWLSPSKCSHLYIWSQWGWNVLFLFVASYALLLSRVSTFCLDSGFENPYKNFHNFIEKVTLNSWS